MVNSHSPTFPALSVAVTTTVWLPSVKFEPDSLVDVMLKRLLSIICSSQVTTAVCSPFSAVTKISSGHVLLKWGSVESEIEYDIQITQNHITLKFHLYNEEKAALFLELTALLGKKKCVLPFPNQQKKWNFMIAF